MMIRSVCLIILAVTFLLSPNDASVTFINLENEIPAFMNAPMPHTEAFPSGMFHHYSDMTWNWNGHARIKGITRQTSNQRIITLNGIRDYGPFLSLSEEYQVSGSSPVPEPSTLFLLGSGLVGLAGILKNAGRQSNHDINYTSRLRPGSSQPSVSKCWNHDG